MSKRKNLEGLIREPLTQGGAPTTPPAAYVGAPKEDVGVTFLEGAFEIDINRIFPDPANPRKTFRQERIQDMADSLLANGQQQPIVVRYDEENDRYLIIMGERRYQGAKLAGLAKLNAIRRMDRMDAADVMGLMLVENLEREDLPEIEEAKGFAEYMRLHGFDSALMAAKKLGVTQSRISRALALLAAPERVQELVEDGDLSASAAREVGKLHDHDLQVQVAEKAVADKLNRDEVKAEVEKVKAQDSESAPDAPGKRGAKRGARVKSPSQRRGRGGKGPVKEWGTKLETGFKVSFSFRKGIDRVGLLASIDQLRARIESEFPVSEVA